MRSMQVVCALFNEEAQRIEVVREITNDDGSIEYNGLSLPTQRLEWISAEYEIENIDELVEIAIYETLMPNDDIHPDAQAARLQKRTRLASIKQRLGPMIPTNNKVNLKARVQDAGLPSEFVDAIDDDAVAVIKRHSIIDPARVTEKRDHVRAVRRGEPSSLMPSPTAPKSSEVRNRNTRPVQVNLPSVTLRGGKRVP